MNKTIDINPLLFKIGGNKTKKQRVKTKKTNVIPIISPNVLKNKLLKRIKEHKIRETQSLVKNQKNILNIKDDVKNNFNASKNKQSGDVTNEFSDEFNDSINYLQTLSKQKKINDAKLLQEKQKEQQRNELDRKTVKNYYSMEYDINNPFVNTDLPEDLKQPLITINTEQFNSNVLDKVTLNPYNRDSIPYSNLKGGIKPSYKEWSRTQRNYNSNNNILLPFETNKHQPERENRLNMLKNKIKSKQLLEKEKNSQNNNSVSDIANFSKPSLEINNNLETLLETKNMIQKPSYLFNTNTNENVIVTSNDNNSNNINNININENIQQNDNNDLDLTNPIKRIIKKTIRRKYTLGKSKIKNTVGILLKDRSTRKKIISAQKSLKTKSINDIKTYLREHNLIKIGSNAPNDVIRKIFESAILAGEITNINKDTLLHNLMKDDSKVL